ncbi:hypothetical protein [Psychroserpens ponticola]|uniref:DUF2807 domain-containing protein n=1 Tax=Psychroserpens ponticola TaxID=2932268 RepID=A0ABY7S2A3_9FLAO|nr:hypothetical protein [Psychroserpens ponticola]WCO03504.1 hypothetical protein MUN68_008340 [Psychroserpens ponticola]WCO03520.1 hypothetical protein MUN68_008425 [Psychroserpens ponticola]
MKLFLLILLSTSLFCSAQSLKDSHEFKFYKNGRIVKPKKVNIYIISDKDTLKCEINENKILIPKVTDTCSILIKLKKETILIKDFDFSKIGNKGYITLGIENNMKNFQLMTPEYPNAYILKKYAIAINIENLQLIKKVCFLNYYYAIQEKGNRTYVMNYTKYSAL